MLLAATVGAGAQTSASEPSVEVLRSQADAIAGRYFEALNRSQELDTEITRAEEVVSDLEQRAERARTAARDRALVAYQQSGSRLAAVMDGGDALDAARRVRLIDQVNRRDRDAYENLRAVSKELQARRRDLEATRTEQAATLDDLRDQGAAVDAKLAQAAQREAAAQAAAATAAAAAEAAKPSSTPASTPAPTAAPPTVAPVATTLPPAPPAPPPPPYTGTPGTHPKHSDPFLTCVRARESGGNYGAVNPAGPYLGAYQFLQSTWNAAANHAHRTELVGVPANRASQYDQDDVAWALYQWQGAAPWGGSCR